MIESAEEFKRLRESEISDDYHRAGHDEAEIDIWLAVLVKYPEMAFWVAQNKTVQIGILEKLAKHRDPRVRGMVACKIKIPESLMLNLARDEDSSVRYALANNSKVTKTVLSMLMSDPCEGVASHPNAPRSNNVNLTVLRRRQRSPRIINRRHKTQFH